LEFNRLNSNFWKNHGSSWPISGCFEKFGVNRLNSNWKKKIRVEPAEPEFGVEIQDEKLTPNFRKMTGWNPL